MLAFSHLSSEDILYKYCIHECLVCMHAACSLPSNLLSTTSVPWGAGPRKTLPNFPWPSCAFEFGQWEATLGIWMQESGSVNLSFLCFQTQLGPGDSSMGRGVIQSQVPSKKGSTIAANQSAFINMALFLGSSLVFVYHGLQTVQSLLLFYFLSYRHREDSSTLHCLSLRPTFCLLFAAWLSLGQVGLSASFWPPCLESQQAWEVAMHKNKCHPFLSSKSNYTWSGEEKSCAQNT